MSFLVVHDISDQSPYAILKVPENATTREVIRQAVSKAGQEGAEHEYVLLEEVLLPNASGGDFLTTPPTQQRMVGMDECPLYVRNRWKSDSKFVLKRVGADPSWRARLGNLIVMEGTGIHHELPLEEDRAEIGADREEQKEKEDNEEEEQSGEERQRDLDNFLVCVFNVSSKVSYSILQVPKTSTAHDVIVMALQKSRRGEGRDEAQPENFALVEETDELSAAVLNGPSESSKKGNKGKRKRVLDAGDNVYLAQLAWKGGGRLILEEREKLLREGQLHLEVPNLHLNVCEMRSDPLSGGGGSKMSPKIRRSSKIIASGVRRISRSFYGGSTSNGSMNGSGSYNTLSSIEPHRPLQADYQHPQVHPQQKQRRVTTAAAFLLRPSGEIERSRSRARRGSGGVFTIVGEKEGGDGSGLQRSRSTQRPQTETGAANQEAQAGSEGQAETASGAGRKLSKVNLRKLKIW